MTYVPQVMTLRSVAQGFHVAFRNVVLACASSKLVRGCNAFRRFVLQLPLPRRRERRERKVFEEANRRAVPAIFFLLRYFHECRMPVSD